MGRCRWNLLPRVPDGIADASGLPPVLAQLLYNRGLREASQLQSFMATDKSLCLDPFLLPDMHKAVTRIFRALLSGEKIAIYGDFDADGVTATALLVQGLAILGGNAIPYIPHRLTEGYGLKTEALEKLALEGVSLAITVDCGITSVSEVKRAQRKRLDIIVTDHHTPLPELPPALAVINPRLSNSIYPFRDLSGVGVAFKLLQAILANVQREAQLDAVLDLVAIGTIADLSPLLGENRYLVKEGLKLINSAPRPGIKGLIDRTSLKEGQLDSESIAWVIGPHLNAAGRLEHAIASYNLLMTSSAQEASELAGRLVEKNQERKKLTANSLTRAKEQLKAQGIAPLLMVSDPEYPSGVAGLVAGKLTEEFYRPAVVVRVGERVSSGSCRSIPEFNIIKALTECRGLLTQFGGHSQAAGFSLPTRNLCRFQEALMKMAASGLTGVDLRPHLDIDLEMRLAELGGDTFQVTQQLAPFGRGNPLPTFVSRRVAALDCRTMGSAGEHLRLKLRQDGSLWDGVGFGLGASVRSLGSPLDIVYTLEVDEWRGEKRLRLNLLDFNPSGRT